MTNLASDEAIDALVAKIEADRMLIIGYLFADFKKKPKVIARQISTVFDDIDPEFVCKLLEEGLKEYEERVVQRNLIPNN